MRSTKPMRNKSGKVILHSGIAYRHGQMMLSLYTIDEARTFRLGSGLNPARVLELRRFIEKCSPELAQEQLKAMTVELVFTHGESFVFAKPRSN